MRPTAPAWPAAASRDKAKMRGRNGNFMMSTFLVMRQAQCWASKYSTRFGSIRGYSGDLFFIPAKRQSDVQMIHGQHRQDAALIDSKLRLVTFFTHKQI